MLRYLQFLALLCLVVILGSCSSIPDNARYIPENAIVSVGIHTNEIGKKIAWNAITGSKLLNELKKRKLANDNASIDPEEMGIELNSVTYIYMKADKRFHNGNRVTALIPLEDVSKWENYITKAFPGASVKTKGDRKNAMLANGMFTGWNKDLLVVMNTIQMPQDYDVSQYINNTASEEGDPAINITDTVAVQIATPAQPSAPVVDEVQLQAEMDNAFNIKKENSLAENKRFSKLETAGHDVTMWVNYDEIMSAYGAQGMQGMMGLNISNVLWKNAAFAAGIDFEKGKITGDMLYYSPDEMKEVAKEMGKESASKEMIEMLPLKNPNMVFTWHLSPKGLKGTLDKMGLLGFVNLALSQQNLSADEVLTAVTGDMAFVVNDFSVSPTNDVVSYYSTVEGKDSITHSKSFSPNAKYLYALKIGNKENFSKLLQLAISSKTLKSNGNSVYTLPGENPLALVVNDKYLVCASTVTEAQLFLQGTHKKEKKDEEIGSTLNNPVGMYINVQSMLAGFDPANTTSTKDSLFLVESKKLFQNVAMYGGQFNNGSFKYNMALHFMNKEENALLQLIDFAARMSEIEKQPEPNMIIYK